MWKKLGALLTVVLSLAACTSDESPIGSVDCGVIEAATNDPLTAKVCQSCQTAACQLEGCELFPCVDGERVVRGCTTDAQCADVEGARCGRYSAPDGVCSLLGDDL